MGKMSKVLFALEEMSNEEMDPTEITNSTAEVEEMHDDLQESISEVEDLEGAIEEGGEAMGTLEETKEVMIEGVENGEGMPESTAKMAEVVLESISARIGLNSTGKLMPSYESFKTPRNRLEATRIAIESFGDQIKKIWEHIINFCKEIWAKIQTIIGNLTKNYGQLEKHLMMLKDKAQKMEGKSEKDKMEKPGIAKFFSITSANDSVKMVEAAIEHVGEFDNFADNILTLLSSTPLSASSAEHMEKVTKSMQEISKAVVSTKIPHKTEGNTTLVGPLPGGCVLKFGPKEDGGYMVETIEAKAGENKEVKVLTKEEIVTVLGAAITEAKNGAKVKKTSDKAGKVVTSIRKASEDILKILEKGSEEKGESDYKKASKYASGMTMLVSKLSSKMPAIHFTTLKMVGDYSAASMGMMKKEKVEK